MKTEIIWLAEEKKLKEILKKAKGITLILKAKKTIQSTFEFPIVRTTQEEITLNPEEIESLSFLEDKKSIQIKFKNEKNQISYFEILKIYKEVDFLNDYEIIVPLKNVKKVFL